MKPSTSDHHTKAKPEQWTDPGMVRISQDGAVIMCSCGWVDHHARTRVREDKAERHVEKRHNGSAMWF